LRVQNGYNPGSVPLVEANETEVTVTACTASLRVAHQRSCAHANKTSLESIRGCTCGNGKRAYYVLWRDRSGASRKSPRVRDRREAEKLLRAKQVEIDQGRTGATPRKSIEFPAWIDEYLAILEARPGIKGETRRSYATTLAIARDAIGYVDVREIGNPELRRFHAKIAHTADATQIKHLSQLGACLSAAVEEEYAERNPVTAFRKRLRLRVAGGTPAFTDGEIERLLDAMQREKAVYRFVVRAALGTGARIGELVALDWRNVNLSAGSMRIEHTYNPVDGLTPPKDRDPRTVYLTTEADQVFADWLEHIGDAPETGLVFPAPRSCSYLDVDYVRRIIEKAIAAAGIPKVDEQSGRPRKPLHSLRATFTRRMLEQGRHPQWVEAQLGHSSLELTIGVYGAWTAEAMRTEASKA
jgi:integrase